ncbi:HAD family hydrolase [Pararhizobium sp.]|uniref:HAD family hydrolase n=1 Tax=Pararhizobium sp. TaxID=1977563 RepID=UPI00272720B8|nr:HAD family hydrolase [Pararhizobium sp.]MDO9416947.1 HAD family hydrolase [Pararhizobium sp.]
MPDITTIGITTIGFDADDTLWQNEQFYALTQARFAELLRDHAAPDELSGRLFAVQKRNMGLYGFGIKGFVLSMIETALEITDHKAPVSVIRDILDAGREMLAHPVETLPGVPELLKDLNGRYRLVLITKGDLFDQERKLAASGLGDLFDAVEIVSDKSAKTYETIFARHGGGASASLTVGNSLKSDIQPALAAGAWGIFVPHPLTWAFEHAEKPDTHPRFREIIKISDLETLLAEID